MISRTKNWAVRNRKDSKNSRNRGQQRKLLLEPLEDRRLLASYMWSDAAGTLSISLGTGEDLTIWEDPAGIRNFQIDSGTFNYGVGSDVAPGDTTGWISFDVLVDNISTSVWVDNTGAGAGTNNVTFAGGTLGTGTLTVNANAGPTSAIDFTGAMTLAGNVSLTANGAGITDSAGSVAVTGTADLQASGQDITLDAAGNNFVSVNVLDANNVTLVDSNGIDLGYLNVAGNLAVTTIAGNITDSIYEYVAGDASFTAGGGGDIMLDALDVLGAIDVTSGGNATVGNIFAADLAASSVGGNLNVTTTAGDILVNGKLTVGGAVNLNSGAAIVVNQPIDPGTVNLTAMGDIVINNLVTATDGINVTAGLSGAGGVNLTVNGSLTTTVPGVFQTGVMIFTGVTSGDVLLTGDITTADGMVMVQSIAGDILMADGSVVDAGNNWINMMATGNPVSGFGDIELGLLISTYTDAFVGDVAILVNAFGAVTDADAGPSMDLVSPSGGLLLMSTNGVGTLVPNDPIEFRASTLDVMNQAAGDINMWTDQSVTVLSAFQTTSTGSIHLTASNPLTSPSITVVNSGVTAATGPGDVRLVAEGPLASIYLSSPVKTDKGDLYLWADHDIIAGPGVLVQAADLGEIQIYANHDNSTNPGLNDDGTIQFSASSPLDISILAGNDNTVSFWLGDCDGFIQGSISAANVVSKRGPGILRLYGTQNNYVGTTNIYDGGLLIEGALTRTLVGESPGVVHVWSSASSADPWAGAGLLGGSGVIKNKDLNPDPHVRDVFVHAGGTLDPGSIDPNTCEHQVGQLTIWGDVFFEDDSTYAVQLEGLVPGTEHDQLVALGTVSFAGDSVGAGGANLVGELRYPAPVGSRWEIVDNDDVDLIDTRFENIPELGFAVFSGRLVNVSYNDDLQETIFNDVVLTAPGRYDFNGFYGYTQFDLPYEVYQGVSPFQTHTGDAIEGWVTDATHSLPWYFERNWPEVPPYSSADGATGRLLYDGQSTDMMGRPVVFEVEVYAPHDGACGLDPLGAEAQAYEVMILTGDTLWNHDGEQFGVTGSGGFVGETQTVNTWGAGAPDGSGVVPNWGGGEANPGAGYYRWIRASTTEIVLEDDGDLDPCNDRAWLRITMSERDLADFDPFAVILAMDIRPVKSVGEITIDPPDAGTAPLSADGVTVDTYVGHGAPPNATLTVTVTAGLPSAVQYAKVNPGDTSDEERFFGGQIVSDELGNFTFKVLRPAALTDTSADQENWTILVEQSSGLSRGTRTQTYTKPQMEPLRFDFGVLGSPLQTYVSGAVTKSFLQVVPQTIFNSTRGYGWTSRVAGVDRKDTVSPDSSSALRRDLNYAKNALFKVNLPDGNYSVRIYHSNPKYNGTVPYIADQFRVLAEGALQYTIDNIPAGTTDIREFGVTVVGGALELQFIDDGGRDGNFVVSGIDISAGALPTDTPLRAAGDPQDGGAAAITVEQLQPVVAEAVAQWTAAGLTPAQTATLANVQFAVADLGGAYLGLANPATNQIRIDNDAAMIGWSVVTGHSSFDGGLMTSDKGPMTNDGVSLLTVVMHELGHLLGHEHSADGLMAPVLSAGRASRAEAVEPLGPAPWRSAASSFLLPPSSLISPASRSDGVFAELESSDEASSPLLESQRGPDVLAATALRSSDEAAQARVPRRSPQRYERDLDEWFSELAAEEAS